MKANIASSIDCNAQTVVELLTIIATIDRVKPPIAIVDSIEWDDFKYLWGFYIPFMSNYRNAIIFITSFIDMFGD
jgi:hypothetical protein